MKRRMPWFLLAALAAPAFGEEAYDPSRFQSTKGRTPFFPLNDAKVVKAEEATYLDDADYVLGIEVNGEARAYPARFIAFHHIVNDTIAGKPACVTY